MPNVKMPDGTIVAMPDDPSPDDLAQLRLYGSPSAQPQEQPQASGLTSQIMRQLGLTARAGITGATGTVGMVGDALNAGINSAFGTHLKPVTQATQDVMTNAGVPTPQNDAERFAQFGGSLIAGGMDPAMTGIARAIHGPAPLYNAPTPRDIHAETVSRGQSNGLTITPNEAKSGTVGRVAEALSGKGINENMARERNVAGFDTLARKAAGLPSDAPLTHDVLTNAIKDTYENGYGPIRDLGHIPTNPAYHAELDKALEDYRGVSRSFPNAASPDVAGMINSYRVPSFRSDDAVRAISQLREDASGAFRSGNPAMGGAHKAVAQALENNISNHLGSVDAANASEGIIEGQMKNGVLSAAPGRKELLSNFRNARTQLAKQYAVRDALIPGAGSVDALNMAAQLRNGAPLTDELRTMGEFANIAPKSSGYPKGGTPLFTGLEGMALAAGGLLGHGTAAIPIARMLTRHGLMSNMGQRMLAQPATPSVVAPFMVNAMPTAYNLGSGLFGQ